MQYSRFDTTDNEQEMLKSVGPYRQQVSGSLICEAPALPHVSWGKSTLVGVTEIYSVPKQCVMSPENIGGALSPVELHALEESMSRYAPALDILSRH
ncbi:MAG: hypothetical protein WC295_00320 [Methanoregula sp.]|jgi:hypothetical protein